MIDLHIHSTASDGSFTPLEILAKAGEVGLKAISITDHDTIDGVLEILKAPPYTNLEFITGVEISCEAPPGFQHLGSIHLLGYGFSVYDKNINAILNAAKTARFERNPKIIEKLNLMGLKISMEQVQTRFGAEQTGRPHIAEMMKDLGYVKTFDEAFDRYLAKGRPAYVEKYKISCKEAIKTVLEAGGIPVLAHPGLLGFNESHQAEQFIDTLVHYGLGGVEVYYSGHSPSVTSYYEALCASKNLIKTGGTDFHGKFNEGVSLGSGNSNLNVGISVFKTLTAWLEKNREIHTGLYILERNMGYGFTNRSFLNDALCHRSYLNENQNSCRSDNERLEFLGDAVIGLCIAQMLMETSPLKKEGELSKLRATLVSEPALAKMARNIDLGRFIRLGKGEAISRGYDKNSILSDAFEAVIAAVYLDAGFEQACLVIRDLFGQAIEEMVACETTIDYKSRLQEYVQERGIAAPSYMVVNETGPDHDKMFETRLNLFGFDFRGSGKTKKAAEQDTARQTLEKLRELFPFP